MTSPSPVGTALHRPPSAPRHRSRPGSPGSLAELVDVEAPRSAGPDAVRPLLTGTTVDGLARLCGAQLALLVRGATPTAAQALLLARPGDADEVLVARDVPMSTHAALVLTGANPVWVSPRVEGRSAVGTGIDPADVAAALDTHPQVRVLFVASPSYAGVCSDLVGLRSVTASHGVALVLDQSWGSHLQLQRLLAADGIDACPDAVITSAQQLLPAAHGLSLLALYGDAFDATRVEQAVRMAEPTAPTVPVVTDTVPARGRLTHELASRATRSVEVARVARSMLARVPGIHVLSAADLALPVDRLDPCTIVLEVKGRGVDGTSAERLMRENHDVRVDAADASHVHLVIGPDDDLATVRRLVIAVASLGAWTGPARRRAPDPLAILPTLGEQTMTPRAAWYAAAESVRLERCVGRTCAELLTAYPPGVTLVAPGEVLTAATVAWLLEALACGMHVRGAADPSLTTLRVVTHTGIRYP